MPCSLSSPTSTSPLTFRDVSTPYNDLQRSRVLGANDVAKISSTDIFLMGFFAAEDAEFVVDLRFRISFLYNVERPVISVGSNEIFGSLHAEGGLDEVVSKFIVSSVTRSDILIVLGRRKGT